MNRILLFICLYISITLFSQTTDENNIERYWYYRDRLKYFVKPGPYEGESCIVSIRNNYAPGSEVLHYGDHTIFLGWYIGVLATEYKLLAINGQNTDETLYELYYALEAFKRLDMCEDKPPWNKSEAVLDGFFMRDDVDSDSSDTYYFFNDPVNPNVKTYFNEGLVSGQSYSGGHPSYVSRVESDYRNRYMSQDQAIHIMMGMALVKKCFDNTPPFNIMDSGGNLIASYYDFYGEATFIAHNIVRYIQNNPPGIYTPITWTIYNPDHTTWEMGSNAMGYSYGFAKAGQYITGTDYLSYDSWASDEGKTAWNALKWSNYEVTSDHMVATLAAIGDSWYLGVEWNDFTYDGLVNVTSFHNWDSFYTCLWKFLHDKDREVKTDKARDQLDVAPCEGPYRYENYGYAPNGWASTVKYRMTKDEQNGLAGSQGNFNGLDYMLMYNIYRLLEEPDGYKNLINREDHYSYPYIENFLQCHGSTQIPEIVKAFETIESTAVIENNCIGNTANPGNVTYRAGECITLKPGFTVKAGSYFHAYIDPFSCSNGSYTKSGSGLYSDSPMFTVLDSIECANNYLAWDDKTYDAEYPLFLEENNPLAGQETAVTGELSLNIYPNPSDGLFYVSAVNYSGQEMQVMVMDMLGKTVFTGNNTSGSFVIDLSQQPSGLYYVNINAGGELFREKVVVR